MRTNFLSGKGRSKIDKNKIIKYLFPILCIILYTIFVTGDLLGPGVYYEEYDAVRIYAEEGLVPEHAIGIFPVYGGSRKYAGLHNPYVHLPFLILLGEGIHSIRIMGLFFGILTLIIFYKFSWEYFNPGIAKISLLLISLQPVYVLYTRVMVWSETILNLLLLTVLLFFTRLINKKESKYLYLLAFVAGIGIWVKITFVLVFPPLLLGLLLFKDCIRTFLKPKHLFIATILFFIGSFPLWHMNISNNWPTFSVLFNAAVHSETATDADIDNTAFFENFSTRINQFISLYGGRNYDRLSIVGLETGRSEQAFISVFTTSFILMILLCLYTDSYMRKKILLVAFLFVIILIGLSFTPTVFAPEHLSFLMPLPHLIIAVGLYYAYLFVSEQLKGKKGIIIGISLPSLLFMAVFIPQLKILSQINDNPEAEIITHSRAVYDLVDHLNEEEAVSFLPLNPRVLASSVYMASCGEISGITAYDHEVSDFCKLLRNIEKNRIYVIRFYEEEEHWDNSFKETFISKVNEYGYSMHQEKIIFDSIERPVYVLYRVFREGADAIQVE